MRIFVTHICPKNRILEYGFSISASNFNFNLISGRGFNRIISIYPGFAKGDLQLLNDENIETVYSSWRKYTGIRQKLARFLEQCKAYKKIPKESNVWFYNVTTLNILLIILLKVFKPSCKLFVIMLDYAPDEFFHKIALKLINKMDGRICLSTYPKFNKDNSICLPGVIPSISDPTNKLASVSNEFLVSGALNENITMLSMLLDAFSEMPEMTLHISGILRDYKVKVEEYCKKYSNINYYGKLPFEEYNKLLNRIPFSFNTRKPTALENQCNFPSKIIEALCHNRIVISTIKYPQLDGLNYFFVASDKESFKSDIRRIASMPQAELLDYANQGDKATELFSADKWFEKMSELEKNF